MCFWRCLAKHYNQETRAINLVKIAKDLFYKYYDTKEKKRNHRLYLGLELHEIEDIEIFFNINVNIYKLNVNENEILAERQHIHNDRNKDDKMTLGLYENHFVYIKNVNHLCKVFRCEQCKKTFVNHDNLIRHQKAECFELYKDVFSKKN